MNRATLAWSALTAVVVAVAALFGRSWAWAALWAMVAFGVILKGAGR